MSADSRSYLCAGVVSNKSMAWGKRRGQNSEGNLTGDGRDLMQSVLYIRAGPDMWFWESFLIFPRSAACQHVDSLFFLDLTSVRCASDCAKKIRYRRRRRYVRAIFVMWSRIEHRHRAPAEIDLRLLRIARRTDARRDHRDGIVALCRCLSMEKGAE